jgi:hypothetical protein
MKCYFVSHGFVENFRTPKVVDMLAREKVGVGEL